ncbi:hypothetical protein [Streptomyces gossypii]|nr:hypothetical protein [Streptomyces gossypii]
MCGAFQAITKGVHADVRCTGWCPDLTCRPRGRRPALVRQDASGV